MLLLQSPVLSFWLFWGSILLCIKAHSQFSKLRNQILDTLDRQIESEHLSQVLAEQKNLEDTEGFTPFAFRFPVNEAQKRTVRESEEMYRQNTTKQSTTSTSKYAIPKEYTPKRWY